MSYGGGSGSGINSVIEAQELLWGKPPEDDPAEEHMRRFLWTVCGWTTLVLIVAAPLLWFFGPIAASVGVAGGTFGALVAIASFRRRNRTA